MNGAKALRGLEAGTKAGYLVLAGLGLLLLWRFLSPKRKGGTIEEVVPMQPAIPPAGPADAPEPRNQAEPQGVVGGSLLSGVTAQIIDPAKDARVYRRPLSSGFAATIEVSNVTRSSQAVQIEAVLDFYELTGGERIGVRTRFPVRQVGADSIERFEVELDSGNFNGLTFEFGQANAVAKLYVNGNIVQSTSFEVW